MKPSAIYPPRRDPPIRPAVYPPRRVSQCRSLHAWAGAFPGPFPLFRLVSPNKKTHRPSDPPIRPFVPPCLLRIRSSDSPLRSVPLNFAYFRPLFPPANKQRRSAQWRSLAHQKKPAPLGVICGPRFRSFGLLWAPSASFATQGPAMAGTPVPIAVQWRGILVSIGPVAEHSLCLRPIAQPTPLPPSAP
jgi:hypothetical protein